MKAYLASGWFNANQAADLIILKTACANEGVKFYSPKDENLAAPDASTAHQEHIFRENLKAIFEADFVIVNTRDKDVGTLFEAGYAFACNKPIIYFFADLKKFGTFNLMLSRSGIAVTDDMSSLQYAIRCFVNTDGRWSDPYKGEIQ